ncbi:hypothetical protein PG994_005178 [Apiospora phragmitis]|uniref:Uncharacterized protein n=1 Tax=Apiospora phragmitis TaxID=2905665 RepID=A0ABR1VSP6_9PEZI
MLGRNVVVLLHFLASALAMPLMANGAIHGFCERGYAKRAVLEQDQDAAERGYAKRAVSEQDQDAAERGYAKRTGLEQDQDAAERGYAKY